MTKSESPPTTQVGVVLPGLQRDTSDSIRPDRPVLDPIAIASLMQLDTPHAVVDCARMRQNIDRVARYAEAHNLRLRPHAKTHKDPLVAQIQLEAGAAGLTVATPREAEAMARVASDILFAFPPVGAGRIDRLLALPSEVQLSVALDSVAALERFCDRALQTGALRCTKVLIELDVGGRRTGLCDPLQVVELARAILERPGVEFGGLLAFFGHVRHMPRDPEESLRVKQTQKDPADEQLRALGDRLQNHLSALEAADISCPEVSGGSTPTLFSSHLVPQLTEIRPGTYVYCDRDVASQGAFSWHDCAYSILSTVVSTSVAGQAVVDAGTKSLAREPIDGLSGFGAVLDMPEVVVSRMSEEHGILDLSRTDWKPKVGDRVRIVPNHACVSVHLQDQVAFVESGELMLRDVVARGR